MRGLDFAALIISLTACLALFPSGVEALEIGDIFVVDSENGSVIHVDPTTGEQRLVSQGDLVLRPVGVGFDPQARLVVQNVIPQPAHLVFVDPDSGAQEIKGFGLGGTTFYGDLTIAPSQAMCFTSAAVSTRFPHPTINQTLYCTVPWQDSFPLRMSGLPIDMELDPSGDSLLYMNQVSGVYRLVRRDLRGGGWGPGVPFGLTAVVGLAVESEDFAIVSTVGGQIARVDRASGAHTILSQGGLLSRVSDIVIEPSGDLLALDTSTDSLIRVDPATGDQTLLSRAGLMQSPTGLTVFRGPLPGGDPCTLGQEVQLEAGTLTLTHEIGATQPFVWRTWAFNQGTKFDLWEQQKGIVNPPVTPEPFVAEDVPNVGWVYFLSGIMRSDLVTCWDFDAVYTGDPAAD